MAKRHEFSFPALMEKNRRKNKEYLTVSYVTNTDREIVSEFNKLLAGFACLRAPPFLKTFETDECRSKRRSKRTNIEAWSPPFL